jgi:hypothetical protein
VERQKSHAFGMESKGDTSPLKGQYRLRNKTAGGTCVPSGQG